MKIYKTDLCVENDCADISDWIYSHFYNGNWTKQFEVTVTVREIDYEEDGERVYVDKFNN